MQFLDALNLEEDFEMKKRNVVTLLAVAAVVGMVAVGCGSKDAETEAPAATTEATTDAPAEAETTEAPAEDETDAPAEAETTEAPAEEETEA